MNTRGLEYLFVTFGFKERGEEESQRIIYNFQQKCGWEIADDFELTDGIVFSKKLSNLLLDFKTGGFIYNLTEPEFTKESKNTIKRTLKLIEKEFDLKELCDKLYYSDLNLKYYYDLNDNSLILTLIRNNDLVDNEYNQAEFKKDKLDLMNMLLLRAFSKTSPCGNYLNKSIEDIKETKSIYKCPLCEHNSFYDERFNYCVDCGSSIEKILVPTKVYASYIIRDIIPKGGIEFIKNLTEKYSLSYNVLFDKIFFDVHDKNEELIYKELEDKNIPFAKHDSKLPAVYKCVHEHDILVHGKYCPICGENTVITFPPIMKTISIELGEIQKMFSEHR